MKKVVNTLNLRKKFIKLKFIYNLFLLLIIILLYLFNFWTFREWRNYSTYYLLNELFLLT
jgi:hypothetical protein